MPDQYKSMNLGTESLKFALNETKCFGTLSIQPARWFEWLSLGHQTLQKDVHPKYPQEETSSENYPKSFITIHTHIQSSLETKIRSNPTPIPPSTPLLNQPPKTSSRPLQSRALILSSQPEHHTSARERERASATEPVSLLLERNPLVRNSRRGQQERKRERPTGYIRAERGALSDWPWT